MNNSWNLLIQECYHDFSDHASQHRKGDIHHYLICLSSPCSCHPLNFHDGKKCSDVMFWLTRPIKPQKIGWNESHGEWYLKINNNKQSPNNNFSSSYLYIHTQTCYWNDPHIGRGTSYRHHINQNIHNKSLRTRDPSELVSLRWIAFSLLFSASLAEARWNYEMFVCYCCCKRVDDIMNLSNKLKLSWTAPQKSLPYRAHVSGAPLLLFNI